jgi:hypothetical protein
LREVPVKEGYVGGDVGFEEGVDLGSKKKDRDDDHRQEMRRECEGVENKSSAGMKTKAERRKPR